MPGVQQDISPRDRVEADLAEYRAVSAMAIAGLFLGIASACAFGHPVFWIVPIVAALINVAALKRIAAEAPRLVGRRAALCGLALALLLGAAAPTQFFVSAARGRGEARQVGQLWLDALTHNNPELALELEQLPGERLPVDEDLRSNYHDEPVAAKALRAFMDRPVTQVLIAAGPDARVEYVSTQTHQHTLQKERVKSLWKVTFEKDDQPNTFGVQLMLARELSSPRRVMQWRVEKAGLGAAPTGNE